jgi:hypothetical protein
MMISRQPKPAGSVGGRSKRCGRPQPHGYQNAQSNHERYLALARAEARNGNTVGAENYYQYAEHYCRTMFPDPEAT